jgi:hypothetical protein
LEFLLVGWSLWRERSKRLVAAHPAQVVLLVVLVVGALPSVSFLFRFSSYFFLASILGNLWLPRVEWLFGSVLSTSS